MRTFFVLLGVMALTTVCLLACRFAWEGEISVARAADKSGTTGSPRDASRGDAGNTQEAIDQRVQQLLDQYGNVRCSDFDNQQQAQDVFETASKRTRSSSATPWTRTSTA